MRKIGLVFALVFASLLLLAACAPAAAPETIVQTVEVEKIVEVQATVEVERTVEVEATVEVEKIVEVVPEDAFKVVPRERTLYYQFGDSGGAWATWGVHNPYAQGFTHQTGDILAWEPLEYYSAFANEYIPWLATGHEYNDDFTELTISIRDDAKWSDGEPFTARDVAFTINMLLGADAGVPFAINIQDWVEEATAPDDQTAVIKFKEPQPRFYFDYLTWKYDTGMIIVPEHIFKDVEDLAAFTYFDPEQGWPVTTGPFKIVSSTQTQKWMDRRDNWWAAETGFHELPEVERVVALPSISETQNAQLSIQNVIDIGQDLPAGVILSIMEQNPKVISHTPNPPYGYMDHWAVNMGFNIQEPPFDNPEIRWAISYAIDRDIVVEAGWEGASYTSELFLPDYPGLRPFLDDVQDLLEEYPTNEYNLEKSAALMEKNGYVKDSEGFWSKDGERFSFDLVTWPVLNPPGPVIAELLRQGGFDVTHGSPADVTEIIGTGRPNTAYLVGHWGSVGGDPLLSMEAYNGAKLVPTGEWADFYSGLWRYSNPEYDKILEEMGTVAPGDPRVMELWHDGMAIWLKDLPSLPMFQWIHRWPMNTTYWEGWPTEANAYVNGSPAQKTFPLIVMNLKATQPDPRE